jgi:stage V sporulation protein G
MEITEVEIRLVNDVKLKAFATIVIDNCFVIRGLKIISGQTGTFVAMPNRKRRDGDFQDIAHPINNATRKWMEDVILDKYKEALERGEGNEPGVRSPLAPPPPTL